MTRTLLLLFVLATNACALQETTGAGGSGQSAAVVTESLTATLHALRKNNGVVGLRAGMVLDDGLVLKHGIVHGGYDFRAVPGHVTLEPGLDLGVGDPLNSKFEGIGAYAGLSGTVRWRVLGMNDSVPAFNVYGLALEIVVLPRGGAWMPPEGSTSRQLYGEWSIEGGLRFVLASDLFIPAQGHVVDGSESSSGGMGK